jgi:predicted site-specific integrase-resolvase
VTERVWTMPDIAARLGVTPELVRQWLSRGRMPEPTGRVQRSPWWQGEPIEQWMRDKESRREGETQ